MESVLREFDTVIFEKATAENVLALVDGTSLLWRLELMGIDAGERRWERLTESCAKLIGSHGLAWLAELCMQELLKTCHSFYGQMTLSSDLCEMQQWKFLTTENYVD